MYNIYQQNSKFRTGQDMRIQHTLQQYEEVGKSQPKKQYCNENGRTMTETYYGGIYTKIG